MLEPWCCCQVGPFPHPGNRYWYSSNGSSWLCAHGKASPCLPGEVQLALLPPPWAARPGRARAALWAPHTRHGAAPASPQCPQCLPARCRGTGVPAGHRTVPGAGRAQGAAGQGSLAAVLLWLCPRPLRVGMGWAPPMCDTGNRGLGRGEGVSFTLRGLCPTRHPQTAPAALSQQ